MCRHHGGTEWYSRAEDDVLQKQSDSTPSGGVGEHAVGSSGGRGGAERGEKTGDMWKTTFNATPLRNAKTQPHASS